MSILGSLYEQGNSSLEVLPTSRLPFSGQNYVTGQSQAKGIELSDLADSIEGTWSCTHCWWAHRYQLTSNHIHGLTPSCLAQAPRVRRQETKRWPHDAGWSPSFQTQGAIPQTGPHAPWAPDPCGRTSAERPLHVAPNTSANRCYSSFGMEQITHPKPTLSLTTSKRCHLQHRLRGQVCRGRVKPLLVTRN
jgi:hypothetical protein